MFEHTALKRYWQRQLPRLPELITRHAPTPVLEILLTQGINYVLDYERQQGNLNFLQRRIARVDITDLNFSFSVTLIHNRLQVMIPGQPAEVVLRTDQESLLKILHNEADPDTLFFRRKLLITGDTELGLYLKNTIDSIALTERIPAPLMHLLTHIHQSRRSLSKVQSCYPDD